MTDNTQKTPAFDLDLHTFRLLQAEPFFAALSRRIHKYPPKVEPTRNAQTSTKLSI